METAAVETEKPGGEGGGGGRAAGRKRGRGRKGAQERTYVLAGGSTGPAPRRHL